MANAAWIAEAFRRLFNAPEITGVIVGGRSEDADSEDGVERYWRDVVRHSIDGDLQAVLDEHCHMLRDWLGHLGLSDDDQRAAAADDLGYKVAEALSLRTTSFRIDIPQRATNGQEFMLEEHRLRTRFAVAFGSQKLDDESGEERIGTVSQAFNSPFWPFVLTSTSVGQEGLDFHLWCHAVVHWNLPTNPVDLEQREGRVHRYKGHAVRRNLAATLGPDLLTNRAAPDGDLWDELFDTAAQEGQSAAGAVGNFASGWGWLVFDGSGGDGGNSLRIIQTDDAQTPLTDGLRALLVIDVWEHAYYLDYQNARAAYVDAFVEHLINWEFASANYSAALDAHA